MKGFYLPRWHSIVKRLQCRFPANGLSFTTKEFTPFRMRHIHLNLWKLSTRVMSSNFPSHLRARKYHNVSKDIQAVLALQLTFTSNTVFYLDLDPSPSLAC